MKRCEIKTKEKMIINPNFAQGIHSPSGRGEGRGGMLPSAYLAPIAYFQMLIDFETIWIEHFENFEKQTCRSRCEIYSPNGIQTLSIPLVKRNHKQTMKEVKISYDYNWQHLHWRSLESAYRRSPFFEYYEDDFNPYYHQKKFEYLIDLNEEMQQLLMSLLKIKKKYIFTQEYKATLTETVDFRRADLLSSKESNTTGRPYNQVFETRFGFIPNLSVIDLLFNQGPRALDYI